MTKWDYRIIGIKTPSTQSAVAELMARHGAEGWELVTIDFTLGWAYFKRPVEPMTTPARGEPIVVSGFTTGDFEALAKQVSARLADQEEVTDDPRD